jgi:hypothetical protein
MGSKLPLLLLLPRSEINSLTITLKSSLLCPEGAALFERHPPHFSTAVYTKVFDAPEPAKLPVTVQFFKVQLSAAPAELVA